MLVKKINVIKPVITHLSNPTYSKTHRRLVGGGLVIIGFTLLHIGDGIFIVHYCSEFIGLLIHAVGAVPFLSEIEHTIQHIEPDQNGNS